MNHRLFAAILCCTAACSANPARQGAPTEPAATAPVTQTTTAPVERVDMLQHWIDATQLRDQVMAGRLADARAVADKLAAQPAPTEAPGWATYVAQIDGHVQAAQAAGSLSALATATAGVGATCGECHAANGANLQLPTGLPPAEGADARSHMARHAWAVAAMWDGLVGPSDGRWSDGVGMLAEKPLHATDEASPFVATPASEQIGARVHDAAIRGAAERDPAMRAAVFAEVLTACGECHNQTHTGPR